MTLGIRVSSALTHDFHDDGWRSKMFSSVSGAPEAKSLAAAMHASNRVFCAAIDTSNGPPNSRSERRPITAASPKQFFQSLKILRSVSPMSSIGGSLPLLSARLGHAFSRGELF